MTDSVETIRCSNCKKDILSTNFVIHDIHCQRNIFLCPKCNEPVNRNKRAEHDADHALVFCTNCHAQVEKYLLSNHLKNSCSRRKVKCQICDIEVGLRDIVEHENYCGSRTEKCSECGEFVMLKYKQLHIDSNHTFIKLSDEPGPSPSWQNGRRTLGNFLPNLQSGLYNSNPSHQKKRLGRSEHGRRRGKGSPDFVEQDEKTKDLTGPNGKQKYSGYQRNSDAAGCSHSRDYRRRVSGGGTDYAGGRTRISRDSTSDEASNDSNDVSSVTGVSSDSYSARSKENEPLRRLVNPSQRSKYGAALRMEKEGIEAAAGEGTSADEDPSLALAIQLSQELNGRFRLNEDEPIAQAIEENAAILSEFSLFDKSKVTSEKNLSKNVRSGKKQSMLTLNYDDDSLDDHFIMYAKNPGKDADDTRLPCQFCDSPYPSYALMSHQRNCELNFDVLGTSKNQWKRSTKRDKEDVVACGLCNRLIPISRYDSHQLLIHPASTEK